ncbi:MAG TPA: MBL fold metallo-hydrolase [Candidatus Woesebacteria bacterium]|nr:MBL fold metallo-hydrolase [Candidatus Woesebacteria bacterium]HPJ16895.1 MBL fold metallo-hydrolase [Candidatus Woesebacteria bacterium]
MLSYKILTLGELETNCYLVWETETKEAIIIDPADEGEFIADECERLRLKVKSIGLTHGHFDHVLGAMSLSLIFKVAVGYSFLDKFLLKRQNDTVKYFLKKTIRIPSFKNEIDLDQIEAINLGQDSLKIIKLPGHTPGGIGFYNQKDNWIISGDTVFADGIGSYDHKYSNKSDLLLSVNKIRKLNEVLILPGHGESTYLSEF